MYEIDATHDPKRKSWVESANAPDADFPIQNLPFGRFRPAGSSEAFRIGVAIGDQVLDLRAAGLIDTDDMNALMDATPAERQQLRKKISEGLTLQSAKQTTWQQALVPQSACEYTVPCRVGDYTDFYTGIHHATTVGKLFRPDNPLMPNYKWVPIGYHGRASSLVVSGTTVKRPNGQTKAADAQAPTLGPSQRLDYELELGYYISQGNAQGSPIDIENAEAHLFGVGMFNDWSARDLQAWEYQPLGPFLSKNFSSTVAPWIVTMEALAPFRAPFNRAEDDPQPLPYLDGKINRKQGQIDILLEVLIQTAKMRDAGDAPVRLTRGSALDAAYWTAAQLVAHHTVNGCNLQAGDLLGSGTLSGSTADSAGSLLELTAGGKNPIQLPNGEKRTFLQNGDTLILRGWCERDGVVRIGLGEAVGTVQG
ncbi:fumarylacetoacetase [Diaphorobacter sp. HDW4B]|uniref:fumarylacetoacetase n=1 Tax=Diaphorobacter sp. HDW4B TaxID=2714925 RepID=UPI001407C173|nr:fumarylacetoacetase [Diaphorobacter sp. HDW4B]QIL69212.1 fumarylacetoacetase [Diaphorobacter sp. HDW4B]